MIPTLDYLAETPSQTAGPYVHIGLIPHQAGFDIFERPFSHVVAGPGTPGERIRIEGRVYDGLGQPCRDVLLEVWQANAAGRYNHPADRQTDKPLDADFRGWGRAGTDFASGLYQFETVKPGPVIGRRGYKPMAPHVNLWLQDLFRGRSRSQRRRSRAAVHRTGDPPRDAAGTPGGPRRFSRICVRHPLAG